MPRPPPAAGLGAGFRDHLVYLFLYAPIFVLIFFSFNRSRLSAHWMGFTGEWYALLWRDEQIIQSLLNSLLVAARRHPGLRGVRHHGARWSSPKLAVVPRPSWTGSSIFPWSYLKSSWPWPSSSSSACCACN